MEYEFSRDPVKGGYHAKFSMEHEVFSAWLVDEVGNDSSQIDSLFQSVEQIRNNGCSQKTFEGREYLLTLNKQDVTLQLNASCEGLGGAIGTEFEEDISINNDNFSAACGLDDFSMMLDSWQDFLSS
jgi:uncharacterized protein YacL (UPF0231 family)